MDDRLQKAFVAGMERMAAWSDLLDAINVFPVADGDTGRNLLVTLSPLRSLQDDPHRIIQPLLISARGNSGIIAARFFSGFLSASGVDRIPSASEKGRELAWKAVRNPQPGTMLDIFDSLADITRDLSGEATPEACSRIIAHLQDTVHATTDRLPRLREAGVVDSGALGMFIYLEGFFTSLAGRAQVFDSIQARFADRLKIQPAFEEQDQKHYCIDMVIRPESDIEAKLGQLSEYGDSVVIVPDQDLLKVHLHADDRASLRRRAATLGTVVKWSEEDLVSQVRDFRSDAAELPIHIMTDAAGSVTRKDAADLHITLLDSYILAGEKSLPETYFTHAELYAMMKEGVPASTSQASEFERHQHYQSVLERYDQVLYLCVGSFYTGNYDIAMEWKKQYDPDNRLTIMDTGAASGRLGLAVMATAMHAARTDNPDQVRAYAGRAIKQCREYLFVDCLKYLARGGRMSKTGAFFGDMLHVKPVVTPTAEGARKVGIARNQKDQLRILFDKLHACLEPGSRAMILLQHTDNEVWVTETLQPAIRKAFPSAAVMIRPLSLTSGVHTGPGTWAVAFLPDPESQA